MVDVTIAGDAVLGNHGGERHGIVWTGPLSLTGYYFYTDDSAPDVQRYRKTIDGGLTWSAPVTVSTLALEPGEASSIFYEPYTPGITTRLIHSIWTQSNQIVHRSLDPATDTLSAVHTVIAPGSAQATKVGIGQARNGDLWVWWASADGLLLNGVRRSTDGGASWADPGANPIEAVADDVLILPASNTGDLADMWFLYHDGSANESSLKFWDASLGTFTEVSITADINWGVGGTASNWMAGVWHDDGHLSLLQWTRGQGTPGDFQCWEINSETSFTQRTNVRTADSPGFRAAVTLDQRTGRLYGAWGDGAAGSVDYKFSDDRGATWSPVTQFSAGNPGVLQRVYAAMSVASGDFGRWMPAWFSNTSTAHETNFDNSVALGPPPAPPLPPPPITPGGGSFTRLLSGGAGGFMTYITPDGRLIPLHTPHDFGRWTISFSGFGTPPIQYITQRGPFQHGETVRDFFLRPRVIQLLIRQGFANRTRWWAGRAALLDEIRPNRQATATAALPGQLRVVETDGTIRDLNVFISEGPRFEPRVSTQWDEHAFQEVLRFIAHDPVAFDPTQVTATVALALATDLVFPITFPITFGSGLVDSTLNINYLGTWLELPVITIVGPLEDVRIDNTTTGEKIELSADIAPGRTVTIDLREGFKTVVDDLGTNLIGIVTSDSDLATFHLAPDPEATGGVNAIRVRGTNPTGGTSVSLAYFDRYFGF